MKTALLFPLLLTVGCTALVPNPDAVPITVAPLVQVQDDRVRVSLESVLVRNAPGAWVRNADWDEYRIAIEPTGRPVEVREVVLIDATGARVEPSRDRSKLIDDTKELDKRYALSGQLARSESGGWLLLRGAGVAATGYGVGMALAPMVTFANMATMVLFPVAIITVGAAIGGAAVVRIVDNERVDGEIKRRASTLPTLAGASKASLVLHYGITPLARRIEISYRIDEVTHRIEVDTSKALETLHQEPPLVAVSNEPADFPALRHPHKDVKYGFVRAKLTVRPDGRVDNVQIVESQPKNLFDWLAMKAWYRWRYNEARWGQPRYVEEVMEFKRAY